MCRVMMYLGEPECLHHFLFSPDSSFVRQSYQARYMHMMNLAGFGMVVWQKENQVPLIYKSLDMPFFDSNLKNISERTQASCLISHIRGVSLDSSSHVSSANIHPFLDKNNTLAFAHNGALYGVEEMIPDLVNIIPKSIREGIKGTTDTEWMHALLLSQFRHPDDQNDVGKVKEAVYGMLAILREIRDKRNLTLPSAINLFMTNGKFLVAVRFYFNYGIASKEIDPAHLVYHSMWFAYGHRYQEINGEYQMTVGNQSLIIASEPLTKDTTSWIQVPQYSLMTVEKVNGELSISTEDIRV